MIHGGTLRKISIFGFILTVFPTVYFLIGISNSEYTSTAESYSLLYQTSLNRSRLLQLAPRLESNISFLKIIENPDNRFDMKGHDVLVFLHIQKTAGTTFEKFLVRNLNIDNPCVCTSSKKRCICKRPRPSNETWLFSRYSTGWVCGLHADYTELYTDNCINRMLDKKDYKPQRRRLFGTTFIRDPVTRFISEFRHVNRGATWVASRHVCGGRMARKDELRLCFDPEEGWEGVTLDEFLNCDSNLAFNRQTRMLADLTLTGCYSSCGSKPNSSMEMIMLDSAKYNLRNLAFFGLKERMKESQYMFEKTFFMKFSKSMGDWNKSKSNDTLVSEVQLSKIRNRNHLDIQLYEYAVALFEQRLQLLQKRYPESNKLRNSRLREDDDETRFQQIRSNRISGSQDFHHKFRELSNNAEMESDSVKEEEDSYDYGDTERDIEHLTVSPQKLMLYG